MAWSAKRKSLAFSSSLLGMSLVLAGAAALTTDSLLAPFRAGLDFPSERSLSTHTQSLAVLASGPLDDGGKRLEGALVEVERLSLSGGDVQHIMVGATRTAGDGRALFELRSGAYAVRVSWGEWSGGSNVQLDEDVRLGVVFDGAGGAHWRQTPHALLESGEHQATVFLRVDDARNCEGAMCRPIPAPGAEAVIYWLDDDQRVGEVARSTTGSESAARFTIEMGSYEMELRYADKTATHRFALAGDYFIDARFDGDALTIRGYEGSQAVGIEG